MTCPGNITAAACQTQAAITAQYNAWLVSPSGTGGCNSIITSDNPGAPSACGGSTTVTFTLTSDCHPPLTCQATFTVTAAPTVVLTCPINTTVDTCQTQAAVNAQFNAWLATASASGGCNGVFDEQQHGSAFRMWRFDNGYVYLHQHLCTFDDHLPGDLHGARSANRGFDLPDKHDGSGVSDTSGDELGFRYLAGNGQRQEAATVF
ncbi:MAG: hypothetical protein IPN76_30685 [Saprospiraceae bacterium]|nr:hypothetical protein [Saprospiraceae bacterium]